MSQCCWAPTSLTLSWNNLESAWGRGSIGTLIETKQLELDKIAEFQKDSMTGKIDHYV